MADKKNAHPDTIKKLTFEQAMAKLQEIVEKVETGQIGLEEAIAQYETGCRLVRHCKQILEGAERKIEILSKGLDGQATTEPVSSKQMTDQTEEQ